MRITKYFKKTNPMREGTKFSRENHKHLKKQTLTAQTEGDFERS